MSNGYTLLNRKRYNQPLGVTTARNDGFLNDSAKGGYLRALGASVPGWQYHTPHLSHFHFGSFVENPLVKHHATQENARYVRNQSTLKTNSAQDNKRQNNMYSKMPLMVFKIQLHVHVTHKHTGSPRRICNKMLSNNSSTWNKINR